MKYHSRIFVALACAVLSLGFLSETHAFVLMGPVLPEENTLTFTDGAGNVISTPVASANINDDLGGRQHPKVSPNPTLRSKFIPNHTGGKNSNTRKKRFCPSSASDPKINGG